MNLKYDRRLSENLHLWRIGDRSGPKLIYLPGLYTNIYACKYHIPENYDTYIIFPSHDNKISSGFEPYILQACQVLKSLQLNLSECIIVGFSNGGTLLSSLIYTIQFKGILINSPTWYNLGLSETVISEKYNALNQGPVLVTINKKENLERLMHEIFDKYNALYSYNNYGHSPKLLYGAVLELQQYINNKTEKTLFSLF
jgi:hypothetical protein